jgi:recombination protein RecT
MTTTATPPAKQSLAPATPKKTFQDLVSGAQFKEQLAAALPKHLTVDRFTRVLMTATLRNPRLLECTQESLFKCIFDAASIGLELDGRRAHPVPYKNNKKGVYECQLLVDYKGLVELAMNSGVVSSIHADVVCDDDVFEVDRGLIVTHKIDYKKPRGDAYAAYCIIRFRDGGDPKCEVMTMEQINDIRARSRAANDGPWVTDTLEMWKKTVCRRAIKWVPLSPEVRDKIERADEASSPINVTPKPMRGLAQMLDAPKPEPTPEPEPEPEAPAATDPAPTPPPAPKPLPSRTNVLASVETVMLAKGITETAVMKRVAVNHPEAASACEEVKNLPTTILVELLDELKTEP